MKEWEGGSTVAEKKFTLHSEERGPPRSTHMGVDGGCDDGSDADGREGGGERGGREGGRRRKRRRRDRNVVE